MVLFLHLTLPFLYGLSWIVLAAGSRLTGACGQAPMMIVLTFGMTLTSLWSLFHFQDWADEQYILTKKNPAVVYQSRHPFAHETGRRLGVMHIGFTTATLGFVREDKERAWSIAEFFRWLFGCGSIEVFGESARIALHMADVFDPAGKKEVLDAWVKSGQSALLQASN